ncbi:MAG: flagellar biosynthetic protein FliQ [Salinisphaeraceae bacterium]|jgi:flagellar biosynthetic protein FliQ|nr:flagellar biosynthetic protein FliQ [Salinisphaeraceae bacterium]
MSPDFVITLGEDALQLSLLLGAPLLGTALVVGLLIGIFQAATQINEMTLSFIPKLLAMALALGVSGPWMLRLLIDYTQQLVLSIPGALG